MPSQTVVFTPSTTMTQSEAMLHIRNLLPIEVTSFLDSAANNGSRSTTITESNGTFTVTNTFTDIAATQYKNLMANVSEGVKTQLANDGWTIAFTPETADLI